LRENLRALRQPGLHLVEHRLVLHARDGTKAVVRASLAEWAIAARQLVDVVDLLERS
jgi:hypothetical protein